MGKKKRPPTAEETNKKKEEHLNLLELFFDIKRNLDSDFSEQDEFEEDNFEETIYENEPLSLLVIWDKEETWIHQWNQKSDNFHRPKRYDPRLQTRGCKHVWVNGARYQKTLKRASMWASEKNNYSYIAPVHSSNPVRNVSIPQTIPMSQQEEQEYKRAVEASLVSFQNDAGPGNENDLSQRLLLELMNRDITPEDYELLLLLDSQIQKKTVPKDMVESFETRTVTSDDPEENCAVCLCVMEFGEEVKVLPCAHRFHVKCIIQWLTGSSTRCPIDGLSLT